MPTSTKCLAEGCVSLPTALGTPGGNGIEVVHRHLRPRLSWLYPSPALFQVPGIVSGTSVKEGGRREEGMGGREIEKGREDLNRFALENVLKCRGQRESNQDSLLGSHSGSPGENPQEEPLMPEEEKTRPISKKSGLRGTG